MSVRTVMVWSGGIVATAGLILSIARLIGVHEHMPFFGSMAPTPYYGLAAAAIVLGLIATLVAPPDRRASARVTLEERLVHDETTLRPANKGTPTTHGMASATGNNGSSTIASPPAHKKPSIKPVSEPAPQAPSGAATATGGGAQTTGHSEGARLVQETRPQNQTPQTAGMETPERPVWGTRRQSHPNDPFGDASGQGNGWGSRSMEGAPTAPQNPGNGSDNEPEAALQRVQARRSELLERLEELDQKANQAKVRFGLGKVSAAGYRQYLAEVDRERMMIESELMETEA